MVKGTKSTSDGLEKPDQAEEFDLADGVPNTNSTREDDLPPPVSMEDLKVEMKETPLDPEEDPGLVYDTTDGTIESKCEACRQTKFARILTFTILFLLDFAEFIFDWMFFYEIVTIRTGLVYAAPEPAIVWILLALCLLGSVVFLIETWNTYADVVRRQPWKLGFTPTLVDVWFVNIPTGILNVRIAACYEASISYVQLAKALAAIFLVLFKIINAIVGYCQRIRLERRYKQSGKKLNDFPRIVRAAILIGVIGILVCSGLVLALTHMTTVKYKRGLSIQFRAPNSWEDVKVDTSKYFDDTSVYLQHPSFAVPCGTSAQDNNWMQLNSIYDVINAEDRGILIEFGNYTKDARQQYFHVSKIWPYQNKPTSVHCYVRDLSTCAINELNCGSVSSIMSKTDNFTLRMLFKPASDYLVIGDIVFNGHAKTNVTCTPFNANQKDMEQLIGKLYYFKHAQASASPLVLENKQIKFYTYIPDRASWGGGMRHVSQEWTTGMFSCSAQGNISPTFDEAVTVHVC